MICIFVGHTYIHIFFGKQLNGANRIDGVDSLNRLLHFVARQLVYLARRTNLVENMPEGQRIQNPKTSS
jgi:hypothetical protein